VNNFCMRLKLAREFCFEARHQLAQRDLRQLLENLGRFPCQENHANEGNQLVRRAGPAKRGKHQSVELVLINLRFVLAAGLVLLEPGE